MHLYQTRRLKSSLVSACHASLSSTEKSGVECSVATATHVLLRSLPAVVSPGYLSRSRICLSPTDLPPFVACTTRLLFDQGLSFTPSQPALPVVDTRRRGSESACFKRRSDFCLTTFCQRAGFQALHHVFALFHAPIHLFETNRA